MQVQLQGDHLLIHEDGGVIRDIPLAAVASWGELVGIDDPVDVIEAIRSAHDSEADPATQETAWTEAYAILGYREATKEAVALQELNEGECDRTEATRRAVDAVRREMGDGPDCVLNRCRAKTRQTLGIADPKKACDGAASSRIFSVAEIAKPQMSPLEKALRENAQLINSYRGRFLHSLTENVENPLETEPEPSAPGQPLAEEIFARYA